MKSSGLNKGISRILLIMIAISTTAWFSSCGSSRRLAKGKPLKNRSAGFLVKNCEKADFQFEWLGMKLSADMSSSDQKESFKATVRIKKDSIIWLSISPALGVEMVRMVITPDSVKYISKVPNNKHYYLGDFSVITEVANAPLNFNMIQNMLVGNSILMDKGEDKFVSVIDKKQHVLVSKFHRKLKRILEYDEKQMLPNTQVSVNPLSREYQKMIKRADYEELMIKRYWLNGITYKVEKALFNDVFNLRNVEVNYEDFKSEDGQLYPAKGRLKVSSKEDWQEVNFKISRLRITKEYDFPFEIPDGYERRY